MELADLAAPPLPVIPISTARGATVPDSEDCWG